MAKHRVLFITQRGERHQRNALSAAPPELEIVMRRDPDTAEILQLLPEVEFLISERGGVIDAAMLAAGRRLKLVQRLGSQTWDIDLDAARRAAIPVCYLPVRTCIMVAEHVLMLMLALARRLRELMTITAKAEDWGTPRRSDEDHFAYNWSNRQNIRGLGGSTVGILGFGEIGVELARRLRAFDCAVLYSKRHRLPERAEAELGVQYASADELLQQSDFVCSLLPLFPETDHVMNAGWFAAMKDGAFFAHCGAGSVVDETALLNALHSGHLAGAALDTFTWEPLRPDDPLLEVARDPRQNLILTPHIGAGAVEPEETRRKGDYINIVNSIAGKPLQYRLA